MKIPVTRPGLFLFHRIGLHIARPISSAVPFQRTSFAIRILRHALQGTQFHYRLVVLSGVPMRFPVWCRNVGNEYDLLLFVANWPQSRSYAWRNLLIARAIENAAYVCGVNRIGQDETSMVYRGDTMAIGVKGEVIAESEPFVPQVVNVELDLSKLKSFREKFPVWKDADEFVLKK